MKVYVDEMPNNCNNCPCLCDYEYGQCCNLDECINTYDYCENERPVNCPLQSLQDHYKEAKITIKHINIKPSDIIATNSKDIPSIPDFIAEIVDRNDFELFKANKHKLKLLFAEHDRCVRKQVCDEINASLMKYSGALLNDNGTIKLPCWVIRAKEFEEKLKEIEKGDKE